MKMQMIFVLACLGSLILFFPECKKGDKAQEGMKLAEKYCGNCHLMPEPSLLTKQQWQETILPRMGQFMGVLPEDDGKGLFYEPENLEKIKAAGWVMRSYPELKKTEWDKIVDYFVKEAPDSLTYPEKKHEMGTTEKFKTQFAPFYFSPPATLLVDINQDGFLFTDFHKSALVRVDRKWNIVDQAQTIAEGAVCVKSLGKGDYITYMGSFSPTDMPTGKVTFHPSGGLEKGRVVVDSLVRPVHSSVTDLNGDGISDLVISEFGKWAGVLSVHAGKPDGSFERKVLMNKPGCVKTETADFNADGRPDVLALFAQGDESMYIFYNRGDWSFEEKLILRFPPSYGSSGFRLTDWNEDGHTDIVHICGDLADFPIPYKPYHGIRIFVWKSKDHYEEQEFIHYPGAYDAIPYDFDQDGDLDLAGISFFIDVQSDLSNGFCFFENQNGSWLRSTFEGSQNGRWIVMDQGDWDGDGDVDLALGNLVMDFPQDRNRMNNWIKQGIPFVLLENQVVKNK